LSEDQKSYLNTNEVPEDVRPVWLVYNKAENSIMVETNVFNMWAVGATV